MEKSSYFHDSVLQMHQHLDLRGSQIQKGHNWLPVFPEGIMCQCARLQRTRTGWNKNATHDTHRDTLHWWRTQGCHICAEINGDFWSLVARISLSWHRQIWHMVRLVVACYIACRSPKITSRVCRPHSVIITSTDTWLNHSNTPHTLLPHIHQGK